MYDSSIPVWVQNLELLLSILFLIVYIKRWNKELKEEETREEILNKLFPYKVTTTEKIYKIQIIKDESKSE